MPETMRAVRLHEVGGPDVLKEESLPRPQPGAGEALIRVEAAGVNFIDIYKRTGVYQIPVPATLGEEGAGTVEAVGEGVRDVGPGQRVGWAGTLGSYADFVVVAAAKLVRIPEPIDARTAAALMLQGMTAHYLATSTWPLRRGDTCLIHAAAGGVGLLLVQIARRAGARILATAGTDEKAALARDAGADEAIVYTRESFVDEVRRMTAGRGVDVIYDSVGRSTFLAGLDILRPRGMMVLFGQSSGAVEPVDPQLLARKGSLFLTRPILAHHTATPEELRGRADDLFTWVASGQLSIRVGAEFPLEAAAEAHRALEGRRTTGKILLRLEPAS